MGFLDQIKTPSKTPSNGLKASTTTGGGFLDRVSTPQQNSQPVVPQAPTPTTKQGVSLTGPLGGTAQSTQAIPTASTPNITPVSVTKGVIKYNKEFYGGGADTTGGIVRNTLLGLPKAAKETLLPNRGYSDEELKKANPTLSQTTQAVPKIAAEFSSAIGELLGNLIPQKVAQSPLGKKLADAGEKVTEYGKPQNVQEAAAMRVGDVLTTIPIGSIKISAGGAQAIARSKNIPEISTILTKEIKGLQKIHADEFAKIFSQIDNAKDVQTAINRLDFAINKAREGKVATEAPTSGFLDRISKVENVAQTPGNVPETKIPAKVTGDSVAQDLKKMGSDRGVSDFLLNTVKKEDYVTEKISIQSLLDSDPALKDYIDTTKGKIRKYTPNETQIPPIVTSEGEVWDGYNRISQAIKNGETEIEVFKGVPKETPNTSLLEEAKKYKSADEFVKNTKKGDDPITPELIQKNIQRLNENGIRVSSPNDIVTLYHGTNAKGMGGITTSSSLNPFSYLATDPNASKSFAFGKKGGVLEIKIPVSDIAWIQDSMAGSTGVTIQTPYKLIKGSDGIYRADRTPFMSTDELSGIWGQANKQVQPAVDENLIVQHNLTEDNLLHVDRLGGLPVPSLAISNKNFPLENFGDITLIGDKNLIDPAEKANKVFNADVYSKRYPSITYTVDDYTPLQNLIDETKDYFTKLDLPEWRSYDRASSIASSIESNGQKGLGYDFAVQRAFAAKEGLPITSTRWEIEDFAQSNPKFKEFVADLYTELKPTERIFKGFTYSGTRRYSEHNIENVLKEMKGAVKDSESFKYGVPSLRASQAKQFKSIDSIKKDRGSIISSQEMEVIKQNFESEFNNLLDKYDIQDADDFLTNLKDYLKGKETLQSLQKYPSTKGVDLTEFINFAKRLKEAPTEYFEVKPQRAVGLSEFKYAVVPNTISAKAEKILIDKGLVVKKFDPNIKNSRSDLIKRVSDEDKIAFNKRRPLLNKDIYMSKDEIREIIFRDIPKEDLTLIFTKELINGVADGSFEVHPRLGNLIRLFEKDGKVSLTTALHESKHYIFSKLSPEVQKEALEIAKKEMGPLYKLQLEKLYKNEYKGPERTDLLLEEYVVDQWAKADATKGFGYKKSVFGKIFTALDNLLKRMVNTYNKVKARAEAIFKERGGSKGGYVNFGGEKPKKTPLGKSVGKVTIGGKEIDITKGGQMDIPVPAKVSEIEKDLIEKKIQLELKQELLENSPFKSKENRLMVDREGRIRELGDIKSKKLIRKVEDRMAESGVSDPAEFSAGVEKYFQDKQDIAKLKRDIVALESTGNFAEGQRKQVKDIVKDSKLLLQESGAPIKTSAEGLPIALSKRQKEIVANSPFKDVSPVRIPVVEGTYAEIKAIEKLASQAESYIHGTPLPQGMTFAEVLEKTVTPIENKIGWFDILVRTPDRVMEGIGLGQEAKDLRTAMDGYWKELPKNLEKISDWLNELGTKEASTRVFKYLDGQAVDLNPLEQKVANEIRSWLATWPDRLGLKQDQRITDYITRIFDNDKPQEFDEELAKIIQDKIPGSVYNPFTLKRLGARGYKEDLGLALDAYVKRSTRKAYMDPVLERIQSKTGSEAALSKLEESQFTYVQDYINNINMRPTKGDKRADNTIKKFFKFFGGEKGLKMVGQRPIATVSRGLRRTASRSMLGLNLGTALRNLSQGVNTYAVLGEKYTTIGYVNLFKQGAFDELKEEGVLNAGFIQDKILSSTAKFWEKTDKVLYSLIEVGELINRGSAYFGAKAKYISENRKIMDGVEVWKEGSSMRDAIDYAKGIVRKTQFSFDSVDTPVGLQGDFVKTVIQFLGYPIKQAEFLFELAKDKNYAGILRYILGGVLFTYTIGQLFDMKLKNLVPTVDLGWPPSIKIFTSLFDTITNAPDKFGNKNPLGKRLQNLGSTAFKTVVPGGTQINKTYQGLKAVKAGGSVDSAGRTQFKVGGTTLSNIRAAAFGKYAGKNAQDYFDKITPSERAYKNLLKYDDKKDFLTKLAKNDPDVAKGVIDILKKKAQGITEEDEKIKNMGVKNGQRAEAINKKLKKLKNSKERKDLLTDYIEKGILTEDVMVQLAELK